MIKKICYTPLALLIFSNFNLSFAEVATKSNLDTCYQNEMSVQLYRGNSTWTYNHYNEL